MITIQSSLNLQEKNGNLMNYIIIQFSLLNTNFTFEMPVFRQLKFFDNFKLT